MAKKVFHVITGLRDGGAEGVLFRLVTTDTINQHYVISLTTGGKYKSLLQRQGIEVATLNIKGIVSLLKGIRRLIRLLRHIKPDSVQTWMYHADLIGGVTARLFCKTKIVWGIRHSNHSGSSKTIGYLAWLSGKLSRWVPDSIVCCSEAAAVYHQKIGYVADKFSIIPNGYDFEYLQPIPSSKSALQVELEIKEDLFLIGCVARWNEQKDHSNLFRAIKRLEKTNVCCLLVGAGCDYLNVDLASKIECFGVKNQVKLLGQRANIPNLMSAFDILVLPSSHGEAFPNVVAEAMACATPCVVTNVGDAAMIVANYGWVVEPKDDAELSAKIIEAINLKENGRLELLGFKARESVLERFDISAMCEGFNQVWSKRL